jgi:hypothetical protein
MVRVNYDKILLFSLHNYLKRIAENRTFFVFEGSLLLKLVPAGPAFIRFSHNLNPAHNTEYFMPLSGIHGTRGDSLLAQWQ